MERQTTDESENGRKFSESQVKSSQVSFICVSSVYTLKHILHIKLTYTYTTAILKELRETIRVTDFKYIQFKSYIHMK